MKKLIILSFGIIIFTTQLFSQIKYTPQYIPQDVNAVQRRLDELQKHYDSNKKEIKEIRAWINDMRLKQIDDQFNSSLNTISDKLKKLENGEYYGGDFGAYDKLIEEISNNLNSELEKFNERFKEMNNPEKYWKEGQSLMEQKQFELAISKFNKVMELSPDFYQCLYYRGYAYYSIRKYSYAIVDFDKFLDKEPNNEFGIILRAWSKFNLKDFSGSMLDFSKFIELKPDIDEGYNGRGTVKHELKDFYGALSDFEKSNSIKPNSTANNGIAWAKFTQKLYKEALVYANKAIELDNKNINAYDTRFEIKLALNDLDGCISDCNYVLGLYDKHSNAYLILGRAYFRKGMKDKACINWSKAGENGKSEAYELISKYCN